MTQHHTPFVHLHLHTDYSLLDGACKIKDAVKIAHDYGMPALAITDHGNMFGAVEFHDAALKAGLKPIIGCEFYIAPHSRTLKKTPTDGTPNYYHLILLARDDVGYKNLLALTSSSYTEGFYYKPRIDKDILKKHSKGLIGLSACLGGEIPYFINRKDDLNSARHALREYQQILGRENFYLELQSNGISEQYVVNEKLIALGAELDAPLVATNDCHYPLREDADAHDTLICLQTGKRKDETERMRMSTDQFYIKSPQEMFEQFAHVEEALTNTIEIAQRCNVEIREEKGSFPVFSVPENYMQKADPLMDYLGAISYEGAKNRYEKITPEIEERLKYELSIIKKMGYPGYFLIVWDLIKYARDNGIPVGPGRGSAAGSLVAYALDITQLDPLRYNLLFERFLNPERVSMPDIDIDFCYNRRKEVVDYVVKKYGREMVTQIITFGTMAARGVIRDVGRVLDIPLSEVDKIAKIIPEGPKVKLRDALEIDDFKHIVADNPKVKQMVDTALRLEGMKRHCSTHAAGVVIAGDRLTRFVPLYKSSKDEVTTQYDMVSLEKTGLLKMDFLGLKTLTVIYDAVDFIKQQEGIELLPDELPLDDKETFDLLSRGDTVGVFQLESSGMRELLRKLKPNLFEEVIAAVALYRPGPLESGMVQSYIDCKAGLKEVEYPHSLLESVLKETYGVILYQEQVMKITNVLAGFTLGEADILRKAMGKKKIDLMEKMRAKFIEQGHKINNIPEKTLSHVYELIIKFAGYGFNKSHSAAYGLIAYQTAYLKAHHANSFLAALLSSEVGNQKKIVKYIAEAKSKGIEVFPPDINESDRDFVVTKDGMIRFGLAAVQNVGDNAIESIVEVRSKDGPFLSIFDFCRRVNLSKVNKRVVESLIKCGAMSCLDAKRSQLMSVIDSALEEAASIQRDRLSGQTSLFDDLSADDGQEDELGMNTLPEMDEFIEKDLLDFEKELLGFWVTGHPLNKYEEELKTYTSARIGDLPELTDGTMGTVGGVVTQIVRRISQRGNPYINANLEDQSGSVRVLLVGKGYEDYKDKFEEGELVLVKGQIKIEKEEGDSSGSAEALVMVKEALTLDTARAELSGSFHIIISTVQNDEHTINQLHDLVLRHHGTSRIYIHVHKTTPHGSVSIIKAGPRFAVTPTEELLAGVDRLLGEGHYKLSKHR